MEAYADYEFYTKEYKGSTIPEKAFDGLALKASFFIDYITFNRVKAPVIDQVKLAVCAVAEEIQKHEKNDGKSSESVGKHSVTYNTKGTVDRKKISAANMYLAHTGLLYRGLL